MSVPKYSFTFHNFSSRKRVPILEHVVCYFVLLNKRTLFNSAAYLLIQFHCQLKQNHRSIHNLNRSLIKVILQFSVKSSRLEVVSNLMTLYDLDDFLNMPPVKRGRRGASDIDEGDEEYRKKRERNNEAVKKSRVKSKQQTQDTFQRVKKLKEENQELEDTTKRLTKELELLKELFIATAANKADPKFEGLDLEKLLADTPEKKY